MTQAELLMWVEAYGCSVTHQKANFYRVINSNGKPMGIPKPKEGSTNLMPVTVAKVCCGLEIPIPDYAKQAVDIVLDIQKNHEKLEE